MKKSELKKIIREEYKKVMTEADIADTKLPSAVLAYLNKFLTVLKKVNLTKQQQLSVILHILDGIGVSQSDLSVYMSKVKGSLSTESILKESNDTFDLLKPGQTVELEADDSMDVKGGKYVVKRVAHSDDDIIYYFNGQGQTLDLTMDYVHGIGYWKNSGILKKR